VEGVASPHVVLVSHGFQKNYERAFANGLAAAGVAVLLISSDQTDYTGLLPSVGTLNLRGSQREDRPVWLKGLNLVRYHLALMWWVARHRPAVVHMIGLISPPWLVGQMQGWWFRRFAGRYVLTVHDIMPHDREDAAQRLAFLRAFSRAQHIVVHTNRLAAELAVLLGPAAPPVTVMEHGIEPLPEGRTLSRWIDGQPVRLLLFGVIMRYKGADVLLEALETFELPFELTIAGMCRDPALREDLQRRINSHRHRAQIRWLDKFVSEAEMERLFAASHILALPYRRIDQSGVLLQAYRHGLPIVATRVGAFEDYVGRERGELCPAGDADAFGAAITRLAQRLNAIDRKELVASACRLHWHRVVRVLLPVYGYDRDARTKLDTPSRR
jgi:glycosyltransferase involved in cell wall biosynthesis